MIQPAGLGGQSGGRPSRKRHGERVLDRLLGHVDAAEVAHQQPRRARTRSRKTRSISAAWRLVKPASVLTFTLERPHLDQEEGDRPGELSAPLERSIEITRLDDQLRERLCEARTPRERFRVVEEVLATRLQRGRKHHLSVRMALDRFAAAHEGLSVRDVAREVGLCQRRFIQVFTSEVGLAPKLFSRVLRFQRARRLAKQVEKVDWAQLALNCGYFDQAHLINEFREFTGLSPTNYLRLDCDDERLKANHVPLIE